MDHSPWTQAVLLCLHVKKVKYTLTSAPGPAVIVANIRHKQMSPILMPILFYNAEVIVESLEILKFLDRKYPDISPLFNPGANKASTIEALRGTVLLHNKSESDSINEEVLEEMNQVQNYAKLGDIFLHTMTRLSSFRKRLQFPIEWGRHADIPSTFAESMLSPFFRSFTMFYMATAISIGRLLGFGGRGRTKGSKWADLTFAKSLEYFEDMRDHSGGPFLQGKQLTYADLGS